LGTLAPERLSSLRKVATIESIGSSTRIEGSKLSDREVENLLSRVEAGSFTNRDEQEVAGYSDVMEIIFTAWSDINISENYIQQLHQKLLQFSEKDAWHRGRYKQSSNRVVAFDAEGKEIGVIFETASPFETPSLMQELIAWYQQAEEEQVLHPLLVIGIFIVVFLEIHPFQDGNGRLSRVLTTLLMLKAGYAYVPYTSLESIVEQQKEAYYLALNQTQESIRSESPNWQAWLMFFLRSVQQQMTRLKVKVEREKMLEARLPELSLQIIDFVRAHGRITMADAVAITNANRNTLKDHFKKLLSQNMLTLHGKGRGAWYTLS
ncbi:MAG: Fic family protein, partial [Bacteroidota bacterium]